ncbi:hypothetical protein K1719_010504 [Acacia pycnantha]|nr:hypothetical protein K1719_010504 [Acacia pycnantha]
MNMGSQNRQLGLGPQPFEPQTSLLFQLFAQNMGETKDEGYEEELLDYEEEEDKAPDSVGTKVNGEAGKK